MYCMGLNNEEVRLLVVAVLDIVPLWRHLKRKRGREEKKGGGVHCAHGGPVCTNKYSFIAIVVHATMLQVENGLYLGELYYCILYRGEYGKAYHRYYVGHSISGEAPGICKGQRSHFYEKCYFL